MKKNNNNNFFLMFFGMCVVTCLILSAVQPQAEPTAAAHKESKPCK